MFELLSRDREGARFLLLGFNLILLIVCMDSGVHILSKERGQGAGKRSKGVEKGACHGTEI